MPMNIFISEQDTAAGKVDKALIKNAVKKVIKENGRKITDPYEISIVFADRTTIAQMNNEYRGINRATDVISFAFSEGDGAVFTPYVLGDIFVCAEVVRDHSVKYDTGFEVELQFVIVHGILHLLGFDHGKKKEREKMREMEDIIMKKLVSSWSGRCEK